MPGERRLPLLLVVEAVAQIGVNAQPICAVGNRLASSAQR
jgi:hypothetical protein